MRETEVKGLVPDEAAARRRLEEAGATLSFAGRIEDRRYDTPDRTLLRRDEVLRLRVQTAGDRRQATLDFKGPTSYDGGYKHRDETIVAVDDPGHCDTLLRHLGYVVTRDIDRDVVLYSLAGAQVRFERYPRMDVLVEVEGPPGAIESAVRVLALPRDSFTSERLSAFAQRFQQRTGQRAAISARELAGDYSQTLDDA